MMMRYVYPLCSKREWKDLLRSSPCQWVRGDYIKVKNLSWKKQISPNNLIEQDSMPPFVSGNRLLKDGKSQTELFAAEVSTETQRVSNSQGEVQSLDAACN